MSKLHWKKASRNQGQQEGNFDCRRCANGKHFAVVILVSIGDGSEELSETYLDPAHGIELALDDVSGEVVAGCVQHETPVGLRRG